MADFLKELSWVEEIMLRELFSPVPSVIEMSSVRTGANCLVSGNIVDLRGR
jgi:hypothetical protein